MKKIFKLSGISLILVGLVGCCATSGLHNLADSNKNKKEASSKSMAPTAKVSLKKKSQDQIRAHIIVTDYNNNPNGSVKLQWKAPTGTYCYDTSFPIKKYLEKNDKTWADVTTKRGDKSCDGKWTANVIYKGKVIATDSITV